MGWETNKDAAIAALANYITAHLSIEDKYLLSPVLLAVRTGLSVYQFHTRFRKVFGLSLASYLLQKRMWTARTLFTTTDTPLPEVAILTGYSEPSSLSRAFKNYFGYPPSAIRQ